MTYVLSGNTNILDYEKKRMLLSIDRVLQLLAEGKSIQKIAEMSDLNVDDVCVIIDDARNVLSDYNKERVRRKYIIKKKDTNVGPGCKVDLPEDEKKRNELFQGAELSMVPLGSTLLMYIDGASKGNPGPAGIGIVINDSSNRQVGKVSSFLGNQTNNFAEYSSLIRALKIAIYFKTRVLKIRTDSELVVKQIKGEYKVKSETIKVLYDEVCRLKKDIASCTIEHIPRAINDKADYLANMAVTSREDRGI